MSVLAIHSSESFNTKQQQIKLPQELWYEVAKNIEDDRDLASFASLVQGIQSCC